MFQTHNGNSASLFSGFPYCHFAPSSRSTFILIIPKVSFSQAYNFFNKDVLKENIYSAEEILKRAVLC